jgi:hypothetical protein
MCSFPYSLSCDQCVAGLPAHGEEAANATQLSAADEHAPGKAGASRSRERRGARGEGWGAWRDAAAGPPLPVAVPPIAWTGPAPEVFPPAVVTLTAPRHAVRGPGGAPPRTRQRPTGGHGGRFSCSPAPCQACPWRAPGLPPSPQRGRSLPKHDDAAQSHAAPQRAQTAASPARRREQPRLERKWADLLRWPHGRRLRTRRRRRGPGQDLLTASGLQCNRRGQLRHLSLQPQLTYRIHHATGQCARGSAQILALSALSLLTPCGSTSSHFPLYFPTTYPRQSSARLFKRSLERIVKRW